MSDDKQKIIGYFLEEAKEHLETLEQGLLNLQATVEDAERVNEVFRAAHSIKGGAAMLGFTSIQKTAHRLEDCLKVLKETPVSIDEQVESLFLNGFDTLKDLVDKLQGPFGLREEEGEQAVQAIEPTFIQLQAHLNALVGGGASASVTSPAPAPAPAPKPAANYAIAVTALLREMLPLFKQAPTAQNRQQLVGLCDRLAQVAASTGTWQTLIQTAKVAIANPDNAYTTLAPLVVKDLKQGGDLLQAGRATEIAASPSLQKLAVQPTLEPAKPQYITVPLEPRAAAQALIKAFNKQQLLRLVQILYKVIKS
ncbi:Hpt domain-containing protein [Trichothermofontia sp.]